MYALSEEAARDLELILEESAAAWGPDIARKTHGRLRRRFEQIGSGVTLGHKRADVAVDLPLRFTKERPFVIAFDPETRTIVRVLHGRMDLARLFDR